MDRNPLNKKIAVIGAGAVGSAIGGLLARAGEDVTLIGRKAHVDTIKRDGLILDGFFGDINVRVDAKEHLDFKPDLTLMTVKTQDAAAAAQEIKPYVFGIPVVAMQNGVRSDDLLSEILGKEDIVSCVVMFGVTFLEAGKITINNCRKNGALLIGEAFGTNGERTEKIAAVLNEAVPTRVVEDIHGAHWTKLIINLNNAIPAATGLSSQETADYPDLRLLSFLLMREGLRVAESANIRMAPLPGIPFSLARMMLRMPPRMGSQIMKFMSSRALGSIPTPGSTLQSIRRGRDTEIDFLNGEIIALGKKNGLPTPYNTGIVNLVHEVEKAGVFIKPEDVLTSLEIGTH